MFKRNMPVIINNRGNNEFGTVVKAFRRKEVYYFDVKTERQITFEGLTTDRSYPVFVDVDLSTKLNQQKLSKL